MRRTIGILSLLTLCFLCHCKKPAPPDETRMTRGQTAAREHKSL